MVDQLKEQLKRALRSHINTTINTVYADFEEHEDLSSSKPSAVVKNDSINDFDRYYDCCHQLVKYIAKNLDTSQNFVEQMDWVILASRNGASKEMLGAVVKQELWFHRRGDIRLEIPETPPILGKRKHFQAKSPSKRHRVEQTFTSPPTVTIDLSGADTLLNTVSKLQQMEVHGYGEDNEGENDERDLVSVECAANEQMNSPGVAEDTVVGDLCLLKPQIPGQLEAIRTWIHTANGLIDAQWCAPPAGYSCSRGCIIRHQNNESELCRTWQRVKAHLEECQNPQCELKTRVELRRVMHLIEVKQLEICGVRHNLKEKKVNWSRAVLHSDEAFWIGGLPLHGVEMKSSEKTLQSKKEELTALEAKKASLCARMDIIRLDWRDEITDSALHYKLEA